MASFIPEKIKYLLYKKICPFFNNINKRYVYIIITCVCLSILYMFVGKESIFINHNEIKREKFGHLNSNYTVYVSNGKNIKNKELSFEVFSRKMTQDEADEYFYSLFESLLIEILNENEDFLSIKTNLNLQGSYVNGINANWRFIPNKKDKESLLRYSNLIDGFGNVHNEDFIDGEEVDGTLNVYFSVDVADDVKSYRSDDYSIDVRVVKRDETYDERIINEIKRNIKEQNVNNTNSKTVLLPEKIYNENIVYKEKNDFTYIYIVIIGFIICFILDYRDKDIIKKEEEKNKKQIKSDYPKIITKLLIYTNAGITIRNAFVKLADNYDEKLKLKQTDKRVAYEEIKTFKLKINSGVNEEDALYTISKNLNDNDWTRFINVLNQNIKNGNKDIANILEVEAYEALYKMKSNAEKLAEEASTKLVLPLMMMLMIVFAIIMIPAFMNM